MKGEVESALRRIASGAVASDLESETLDFKEESGKVKDTLATLTRAATCFANARGGTIVLGVADKASGPNALAGTELD